MVAVAPEIQDYPAHGRVVVKEPASEEQEGFDLQGDKNPDGRAPR
jgi:hypothetical protein